MVREAMITTDPVTHLLEAVRRHPGNRRYLELLAEAHLSGGRPAKAIAAFRQALGPEAAPRGVYLLALAYALEERWAAAEGAATQVLDASPGFDRAWYLRARVRRARRERRLAFADAGEALALAESDPEYRLAWARLALEIAASAPDGSAHGLEEALGILERKPFPAGTGAESGFLRGLLKLALGSPAAAVETWHSAAGAGGPAMELWRGVACFHAGRGREATTAFEAARKDPATAALVERHFRSVREGLRGASAVLSLLDPDQGLRWPPLETPALRPLPRRLVLRGRDAPPSPASDPGPAWDLAPVFHSGNGRTRTHLEVAQALGEGRRHLAQERPADAARVLAGAWERVGPAEPGDDAPLRQLRQAIAEAFAVAIVRSGESAPPGPSREELFAAGARFAPFLRALVIRCLEDGRSDALALDVLVAWIESEPEGDRGVVRRALARLAESLRFPGPPGEADAGKVLLLERLHRARPQLAFPRLYLGRHRYRHRDYLGARHFLDGIQGGLAGQAAVVTLRARCAERLGDTAAALALYRQAIERHPRLPAPNFWLGRLLQDLSLAPAAPADGSIPAIA